MTFMDDIHHDSEEAAMKAVRTLQLWLRTIRPAPVIVSEDVLIQLDVLAEAMDWQQEYDAVLGVNLVKVEI